MASDNGTRIARLESDHRALLVAFGAAFVILIGTLGGGYLALANKIDSGFSGAAQKSDALTAQVADIKTDVAVLTDRSSQRRDPAS